MLILTSCIPNLSDSWQLSAHITEDPYTTIEVSIFIPSCIYCSPHNSLLWVTTENYTILTHWTTESRLYYICNCISHIGCWFWLNTIKYSFSTQIYPGALCNIGYSSKTHLKPKSRETLFARNLYVTQLFWNFAQSMAVSLPYSAIWILQHMLRMNEISRNLSLRCVSDGYPIFHRAPGCCISHSRQQLSRNEQYCNKQLITWHRHSSHKTYH